MNGLRIGIDARELSASEFTGIRTYLGNFVEGFRGTNTDDELTLYTDRPLRLEPDERITVRQVAASGTLSWDHRALPSALKDDAVDILFSPYDKAPFTAPCPVVVTFHDLIYIPHPERSGLRGRLHRAAVIAHRRQVARRADHLISVSVDAARDLNRYFDIPMSGVTVVPNALGARFTPASPEAVIDVRERTGLEKDYVLHLGNWKPHKNVAALVDGWSNVSKDIRDRVILALAGFPGSGEAAVRARIAARDLGDSVQVVGGVSVEDQAALYTGATLFAFPSLKEGFGLPPLEAMACGTPVAASTAAPLPEVLAGAPAYFDPRDDADIARVLTRVLSDAAYRARLKARGLQRAAEYSVARFTSSILSVLRDVARSPKRS